MNNGNTQPRHTYEIFNEKLGMFLFVSAILGPVVGAVLSDKLPHWICGIIVWITVFSLFLRFGVSYLQWKRVNFRLRMDKLLHCGIFCVFLLFFMFGQISLFNHSQKEAEEIAVKKVTDRKDAEARDAQKTFNSKIDNLQKNNEALEMKRLIENEVFFVGGDIVEITKAYDQNAAYIAYSPDDLRHFDSNIGINNIIARYLSKNRGKTPNVKVVGSGFVYKHLTSDDPILYMTNTKAYAIAETQYRNTKAVVGEKEGSFQSYPRNKMLWVFTRPNANAPWKIYEVYGGLNGAELIPKFNALKRDIESHKPRDANYFALPITN